MRRSSQIDMNGRSTLLGLLLCWLVGTVLFVPMWAGLNFAFGNALDGPIGAFAMETPCQRLAGTKEPLVRYSLAGKGRHSSSVCHFASGPVPVMGRTEQLGFGWRELAYIVVGLIGYLCAFVAALVLAFRIVRAGRRFVSAR